MEQCKWSALCKEPRVGKTYCDAHRRQHLARTKEWQARNKDKVAAWRKQYYRENLAQQKADHKAYYEANKDQLSKAGTEWRNAFKERDPEGYAQWLRNIRAKHKQKDPLAWRLKCATQRANKRARKHNRHGVLTYEEVREIYDRQEGKCFDCGAPDNPPDASLAIGHGIPLFYRGGMNVKANLLFQCRSCNSKQHLSVHPKFGDSY